MSANAISLSVLHYNTLASDKADQSVHGFPYVDADILKWENRGPRIVKHILRDRPDFICLQEVDRPDFFDIHLKAEGYDGVFVPKVNSKEGLAIYWNVGRFVPERQDIISYGKHYKDDQSQVACFMHMHNATNYKSKFIIGTTHLKAKANPVSEHIRMMQCRVLAKYVNEHTTGKYHQTPFIMTGDMNDTPTSQPIRIIRETGLHSAYMFDKDIVTTCKKRGPDMTKRMIDYIWYYNIDMESADMLPTQFPDIGLPSDDQPSDHLALSATFQTYQDDM